MPKVRIDSHQHFWDFDPQRYPWIGDGMEKIQRNFHPEELRVELNNFGIDGCIAVQAVQSESESVQLLEIAKNFDFVKGVVGWVDLTRPDVEDRLQIYNQNPLFKGVRHTVWDSAGEFMEDPGFLRGINALKKYGMTYDILVFDQQLDGAKKCVRKNPQQNFVLDHLGKPRIAEGEFSGWAEDLKELGAFPNVYCKISGFLSQAGDGWSYDQLIPYLDLAVEVFGPARLMFGSDWPVCLIEGKYGDVLGIVMRYFDGFSDHERDQVFGENASVFYNLK